MADNNDTSDSDALGSASGASSGSGVSTGTQESTSKAFEGSIKQATDVGFEEATSFMNLLNELNAKRTYDQSQSFDLSQQVGDSTQRLTLNNLATQALQNAIETANMVSKQAVRHSDIAIDRQWNVDEVSTLTAKSGVEADAVIAALVAAVARELKSD